MGVVTLNHVWLDTNPRSHEIELVVCMCLCVICLYAFVSMLLCTLYVIIYVLHHVPLLEFKDAYSLS